MPTQASRRTFLRSGATLGALAGLGNLDFLARLAPVSAAETQLPQHALGLQPDVAPIVRLIEETPREDLLEVIAKRINGGLSYQTLLAALLLAGVKNVEPRPSVGHKFHSVLVVNSAHLASMASPDEHRWLPIFWALDYYKVAAARDVEERGDWVMEPVDERAVPGADKAAAEFTAAMDAWDDAAADAAIVGLARTAGANDTYEHLFRYGMRDFRSIGHKAIYVANSLRTLNCIGWRHSEPVLRSLAYALLMHEGDSPRDRQDAADVPYRKNLERVAKLQRAGASPPPAHLGKPTTDNGATTELLTAIRRANNDDSCNLVIEQLTAGVPLQSIWDGLHLAAGELLMRQPGIASLHAVTTSNALRYAYETSGDEETRLLLTLQNAAFLPMFLNEMGGPDKMPTIRIDELAAGEGDAATPPTIDAIFNELGADRSRGAQLMLTRLSATGDANEVINASRVLTFLKGNDAHDYKFSSAVLEDYYNVSPAWRDRYLASNAFNLNTATEPDNDLVEQTRAAFNA
ncbi:hypothetical protein [Lacipirellula parvula]|uniref:Twin-arginine translocation signal domain-containing protein n=1 Tax=Lacipirellula parvula TaxID=2650471 RepID=A0A5K7X849_9BACT|nr:hypothetical protein [Lacipirellula parvula]BBO30486.1 hypothetical protein PLANPX_0098 [Lacipirellula parvula]